VTIAAAADGPAFSLRVGTTAVVAPSRIGLAFEHYRDLGPRLAIVASERSAGVDRYALAGKTAQVADGYNELTVHMAEPGTQGLRLDLVVRAYATGIALRYRIPVQPALPALRLVGERTRFAFPADMPCTGLNIGRFDTGHEGEFDTVAASAIRPHNSYDLPVVCRPSGGPALAFAEAAVADWPVAYLTRPDDGTLGLAVRLSPHRDAPGIAVTATVDHDLFSPWRVVMVAAEPGKLIENTLLTSLSPPPHGDFSWVRAGKAAWDWWSGPQVAGVAEPGSNDATLRAFADFAGDAGLPYLIVDDGWYVSRGRGPELDPAADPTVAVPGLDLPGLIAHARVRGVGLILWVHWKLLEHDMERVLATYERWGIKGIKVDFLERDDQAMVGFITRLLARAAAHHLVVDLHGVTHPWGLARTWPNLLTQEGVMGAEYNKWTFRVTAAHNVMLAYTRMLTGPMDYTPGGFRNATPATFTPRSRGPETQTTRGAALAMYVVFDSPLTTLADSPDAYHGAAGFDVVRAVPTTWDETRFVAGSFAEWVAVARRKGTRWYVGAMTDAGRRVALPLGFLGPGRFVAATWQDGAGPTDLVSGRVPVSATGTLDLILAPSGGAVAVIDPATAVDAARR